MKGKGSLMENMPAPIAVAWIEYERERPSFAKLHRLVDTYEAVLKYASILATQNFYAAGFTERFPEAHKFIGDGITCPTLGQWEGFLREVLRCFAQYEDKLFCRDLFFFHFKDFGEKPKPQRTFTPKGASGKLLILRNTLAHGATLRDEDAAIRVQEYDKELGSFVEYAAFLANLPLYWVEAQVGDAEFKLHPLTGTDSAERAPTQFRAPSLPIGHVVVHNPNTENFLDLHPLLLYSPCQEMIGRTLCLQRKVLFFNELKDEDRITFLDYWRGHHSRFKSPDPLPADFRSAFPKPTRFAQQEQRQRANWFDSFVRERTTHFVGREQELQKIDQWVADHSKRTIVIVGPPGIGKSTLLAKWSEEHQAVRHFIREGDAATYDSLSVFTNLSLQLSEKYKDEWRPPAQPEPAVYRRAFEEMLGRIAKKVVERVVIVVDGRTKPGVERRKIRPNKRWWIGCPTPYSSP